LITLIPYEEIVGFTSFNRRIAQLFLEDIGGSAPFSKIAGRERGISRDLSGKLPVLECCAAHGMHGRQVFSTPAGTSF
jgi:hypothetical protein